MPELQPIIIKKKKVSGHGGHHGGSWKVAYADFVTAMMAFFMVMWIMGLSDSDKSQISGYFNDPMGFMKTPPRSKSVFSIKNAMPPKAQKKLTGNIGAGKDGDAEAMQHAKEMSEGKRLADKIERSLQSTPDLRKLLKNIEFEITKEGVRIEFVESTGSVFFESGSYHVRPQAKTLIAKIAPLLKAANRPMIVEGHTDAKPYSEGATFDNWNLSTMRALALREVLAGDGLGSERFLAVRGLADTELKFPDKPFDFRNRRVTLLLPWSKVRPTVVGEMPKDAVKDGVAAAFHERLKAEPPPITIAPTDAEKKDDEAPAADPVHVAPASDASEHGAASAEAHAAPTHAASGHSAPAASAHPAAASKSHAVSTHPAPTHPAPTHSAPTHAAPAHAASGHAASGDDHDAITAPTIPAHAKPVHPKPAHPNSAHPNSAHPKATTVESGHAKSPRAKPSHTATAPGHAAPHSPAKPAPRKPASKPHTAAHAPAHTPAHAPAKGASGHASHH